MYIITAIPTYCIYVYSNPQEVGGTLWLQVKGHEVSTHGMCAMCVGRWSVIINRLPTHPHWLTFSDKTLQQTRNKVKTNVIIDTRKISVHQYLALRNLVSP